MSYFRPPATFAAEQISCGEGLTDIAASDEVGLTDAIVALSTGGGTICVESDIELSETLTIANTSITLLGDSPDNNWTISTSAEFVGSFFRVGLSAMQSIGVIPLSFREGGGGLLGSPEQFTGGIQQLIDASVSA